MGEIVIKFFSHPFIVGTALLFISKYVWFDKYLFSKQTSEDFHIKKQTIYKIHLIKEKLKVAKFYYDRMINTIELAREDNQRSLEIIIKSLYKMTEKEIQQISPLINNDIPLLHSEINSLIDVYFENKRELHNSFNEYSDALSSVQKFMVGKWLLKNGGLKKSDDFPELNLKNLTDKEQSFIKKILNSDSIFYK
ncbi:hypothetical protein AMJ49_05705 [Parcubacteria bacterium DG_74_2]|nr:MAG: hypothetical protein AMJ49_05705 [Parcubacteria bacterium DG_74_2]